MGEHDLVRCPACNASGICGICHGSGVDQTDCSAELGIVCPECGGTKACPACGGTGRVPRGV
jgi:hypothetical protein